MKKFLIGCVVFLIWNVGYAQMPKDTHCATMEMDSISRVKFPQRGRLIDFEDALRSKIEEFKKQKSTGRIMAGVVSIPIVVHVIHNGEPVGSGTNLSLAQVQAQIEVLNEDFRKKPGTPGGSSNNPVAADIEIEFCLSPVGQNGEALDEPGIHRYNGGRSDWTRDQIENQLKPITIWNANLFYNIWTVRFNAADANLVGYAQFPDQSGLSGLNVSGGPASTDGVVVRYQSFGSVDKGNFPVMVAPYNKGRTLSHETGHWLGLRHIWGDGACADDFVADTPTQQGPSSGCPLGRVSCGVLNMVENYMDYSDDACMNIFTMGQKTRMQAVIAISPRRKSLIEANLCSPPVADVPTTNFDVANLNCVLLGSTVDFTDLSTNFPTEWHWTFEGGNPATSNDRNPRIQYNSPGSYFVSLWTKNSLGTSDTLKIEGLINVTEEGICRVFNNFEDSYTRSLLKLSDVDSGTGYLTGTNSLQTKGLSEFFVNACGYQYISGLTINFGKAYTLREDATVNFVVWNARGPQNAPGSVIERKVVLLKQIQDDIANERPTTVVFDRETPVFGKPFQVGIELLNNGDTLAIHSSANGESSNVTSWIKESDGVWSQATIAFGANIAMDIQPIVGMNPSVQVSSSVQLAYPGQEVILNGKGASIFVWNSDDGMVNNYTGPQLIVNPIETTTYITTGSGLDLCNSVANTTIYVSDNITEAPEDLLGKHLVISPNPGTNFFRLNFENSYRGKVKVSVFSAMGSRQAITFQKEKTEDVFDEVIEVGDITTGLYLVQVEIGNRRIIRKWVSVP